MSPYYIWILQAGEYIHTEYFHTQQSLLHIWQPSFSPLCFSPQTDWGNWVCFLSVCFSFLSGYKNIFHFLAYLHINNAFLFLIISLATAMLSFLPPLIFTVNSLPAVIFSPSLLPSSLLSSSFWYTDISFSSRRRCLKDYYICWEKHDRW